MDPREVVSREVDPRGEGEVMEDLHREAEADTEERQRGEGREGTEVDLLPRARPEAGTELEAATRLLSPLGMADIVEGVTEEEAMVVKAMVKATEFVIEPLYRPFYQFQYALPRPRNDGLHLNYVNI